jgi:PD-(D/E)XK nuclease superfamily
MVTLHFGLAFNDSVYHGVRRTTVGETWVGPLGLQVFLSACLGLTATDSRPKYLRVMKYRYALAEVLDQYDNLFYKASFEADPYATAGYLLSWRDDLVGGGWDFSLGAGIPERLALLTEIESRFQAMDPPAGFEDRFETLLRLWDADMLIGIKFIVYDPLTHCTPVLRRVLGRLATDLPGSVHFALPEQGVDMSGDTDLRYFQRYLLGLEPGKSAPKNDGSLVAWIFDTAYEAGRSVIEMQRTGEIAADHVWLLSDEHTLMEQAWVQAGMPAAGNGSRSIQRPVLQMLQGVTALLWQPLDPTLVQSLLMLPFDWMPYKLRRDLADVLAKRPGIYGTVWNEKVAKTFDRINETDQEEAIEMQDAYTFWFEGPRFDVAQGADKQRVIAMYRRLHLLSNPNGSKVINSLKSLALEVVNLLDELPMRVFQPAELSQVLRAAFEPIAEGTTEPEAGHSPFVFLPTALAQRAPGIVWWHAVAGTRAANYDRLYPAERSYLAQHQVVMQDAAMSGAAAFRQDLQPVLMADQFLGLVVPQSHRGEELNPNSVVLFMENCFGEGAKSLIRSPEYAKSQPLIPHDPYQLQPNLQVDSDTVVPRVLESPSSLESLILYPHVWTLRYSADVQRRDIPSEADKPKLVGELSHRAFEWLFSQAGVLGWTDNQLETRFLERLTHLIETEGTVLMQFGNLATYQKLIDKAKLGAKTLRRHIVDNGWDIHGVEVELTGEIPECGIAIRGFADLVLRRRDEWGVIDMKWAGSSSYYSNKIKSQLDLQLMWYGYLLGGNQFAHTAYYLIEKGTLISRNRQGFRSAQVVAQQQNHIDIYQHIWHKTNQTINWRLEQLRQGGIELRHKDNLEAFGQIYDQAWLIELLELPTESSRFDPYLGFIGAGK